ncbi:MAG: ABC transporter ATP-binding protein [Candidatus Rokubacteria bacterium]|nr:ABC transporter ATP-binding protein [Candidatus Rokubacteria bacterium]
MESLSVRSVHVHFGGLRALDGVDLEVPEGSIYGLIGPNGAGKTTLFNCVSRFQDYSEGSVRYRGHDLGPRSPHQVVRLGIARTFQNINLFRSRSTLDNILIGMHSHIGNPLAVMLSLPSGLRRETAMRARAGRLAEMLGLGEVLEQQVVHLPFGHQKRVELARALASEPSLLLLDEPVAGCNEEETSEIGEIIRRINRELGVTVTVVEHDMSLVSAICHAVTVLDFGRNIARGAPTDILNHPAVVEAYLGEATVGA